ncbi:MAG: RNB domain-containing ribonuclease [Bdellovibrionota bacterium]|jgi:exoribonuclease R
MSSNKTFFASNDTPLNNSFESEGIKDALIFEDAKRTIPIGVELLEESLNRVPVELKDGVLELVALRLYVPPQKEASLKSWIAEFEERHSIKLVIQRHPSYKGIQNLFNDYLQGQTILTAAHIPTLETIVNKFFGTPPVVNDLEEKMKLIQNLPDLTNLPLIAIDAASTKDPEDAFCVEELSPDLYRLTVAISDISWMINPRGAQLDFAINLGATIYTKRRNISTLGVLATERRTHFSLENKSPAWVLQFEISTNGKVKVLTSPFLADVLVHRTLTPDEIITSAGTDQSLQSLMKVALLLKLHRLGRKVNDTHLQNIQVNPGLVVSEIMIKTKESFAAFLDKYKSKKAIFKVQQNLSLNKIRELVRTLRKMGIFVRADNFRNPILLTDLLSELQEMSFDARIKTGQDTGGTDRVMRDILDVLLKRAHYDSHNRGHKSLSVPSYCDIKGRLAAGIINQIQARNILTGSAATYSNIEIRKMVNKLNRQMKNYGIKVYTLSFLEMLKSKLATVGDTFQGEVVKTTGTTTFIDVAGFKRWGVVHLPQKREQGTVLEFKLKGYSLQAQRFLFEVNP